MKDILKEQLAKKIDSEIAGNLVDSYEKVRKEYFKNNPENLLNVAGKFAEHLFITLEFLNSGKKLTEVKNMTSIRQELEKNQTLPEPIRVIIPRIASSLVYDTRSKMGAAHVKAINPDFIDAELVMTSCNWIMSELLRNYYTRDAAEVNKIIKNIIKRETPLIQRFDKELLITKKLGCENEILLILYDSEPIGLSRGELGKLVRGYSPGRITQCIDKFIGDRTAIKLKNKTFRITDPGERLLFDNLEKSK